MSPPKPELIPKNPDSGKSILLKQAMINPLKQAKITPTSQKPVACSIKANRQKKTVK